MFFFVGGPSAASFFIGNLTAEPSESTRPQALNNFLEFTKTPTFRWIRRFTLFCILIGFIVSMVLFLEVLSGVQLTDMFNL